MVTALGPVACCSLISCKPKLQCNQARICSGQGSNNMLDAETESERESTHLLGDIQRHCLNNVIWYPVLFKSCNHSRSTNSACWQVDDKCRCIYWGSQPLSERHIVVRVGSLLSASTTSCQHMLWCIHKSVLPGKHTKILSLSGHTPV